MFLTHLLQFTSICNLYKNTIGRINKEWAYNKLNENVVDMLNEQLLLEEGKPYLEVHHVVWLSRGGEDSTANTVALCPNCHTRLHVLDQREDIEKLQGVIKEIMHNWISLFLDNAVKLCLRNN